MVIRELINSIRMELTENAEYEAREIAMYAAQMSAVEIITQREREITEEQAQRAFSMLKRRLSGEPLQYIIGKAEFMGMEFEVNPYTLIPRQDTEKLIEVLLDRINDKKVKILDIGTGSGCIGISLVKLLKNAEATLADISAGALETAKRNAELNGVRVNTIEMDILKEFPHDTFDVIVSNPPYIETDIIDTLQTEVKDFEPMQALDGGKDGLIFYRTITENAPLHLNENGILAFEIGYNQGSSVKDIMSRDLKNVQVIKDYCHNDRVVIGNK